MCPARVRGAAWGRRPSSRPWAHVQMLLADPEVLRHQYEQGRGDPAVDVQAEHERTRLERKLAALEREKTRLLDAYQAEVIELTELAEWRERLTEQGQLPGTGSGNRATAPRPGGGATAPRRGRGILRQYSGRYGGPLSRSSRRCYKALCSALWWRITASPLSMSCRAGQFDCNRNIICAGIYGFA